MDSLTGPLDQLRLESARFGAEPYLITVTSAGKPHCSPVRVEWADSSEDCLIVPAPRAWSTPPVGEKRPVSLLYPPVEPGGYSLVVDGDADGAAPLLTVRVTRAVLHRRGQPARPDQTACGSDCVPIFPRSAEVAGTMPAQRRGGLRKDVGQLVQPVGDQVGDPVPVLDRAPDDHPGG